LYFQRRELIYKATACTNSISIGVDLESNCMYIPLGGTTLKPEVAFKKKKWSYELKRATTPLLPKKAAEVRAN